MNNKKTSALSGVSFLLAAIISLSAIAYFVCNLMEKRAYKERWSDYDECGLG
jgi:hypothetical protein